MSQKQKEKTKKMNKLLVRILYYIGLIVLMILFGRPISPYDPPLPLYQEILLKGGVGGYILLGLYLCIIHGVPIFSRYVSFGKEEEYTPGLLDLIIPIFLLTFLFTGAWR